MAAAMSHLHEERGEDVADELRRAQAENVAADRGGQVDAQVHDDLRYQDTDRCQTRVLASRNQGYIDVMNHVATSTTYMYMERFDVVSGPCRGNTASHHP